MSDPFVAEIRIFPFNFAPTGWAFCNGQIMPISQNTALFSLLGTMYGGDGKSTFALPNLQGSAATQFGQGPGLQTWYEGETQGSDYVTLLESEMPSHNHTLNVTSAVGTSNAPAGGQLAKGQKGNLQASNSAKVYSSAASPQPNTGMNPFSLSIAGGSLPHNNMMPYLTLNFCIALQGIFPPRS